MSEDPTLTVGDIASRLSVSRETVLRWLRKGQLIGVRIGGTKAGWRIKESDLQTFIRIRYIESRKP